MRRVFWLLAALGALAAGLALYARFIEPVWLQVTHDTLPAHVSTPLRIAHLSDLHTLGYGRLEQKLVARLTEERPDVIVITGDSRSMFNGTNRQVREVLARLQAPLGVWIVRGNWDDDRGLQEVAQELGDSFHYLKNEAQPLRPNVWVAGLDDGLTGYPDWDRALQAVQTDAYTVALFHTPVTFDAGAGRVDLALAGHTHGGQVRLPLLGPLWLPPGSGRYDKGWYEEKGTRLYVSRGLGVSIEPIRFLCRPELAIITLEPNRSAVP